MLDGQSLVGKEISGCEILTKVAEGGMGAVFKARHKALNRIVCVKILSPSLANDKKAVALFLTEARAIAELDHPNIVNVYNVGKEQGYYFIVMSFIEGQTLSATLKKEKVLPIGRVLDLFDGVLKGLSVAHEKGIIHRDIKPSNILITPEGNPKIVDFGIAKKVDKEKGSTAKTTELAGTAYFIAPEQALGKEIDARADLYSIGASMYYVLTGHFPYNGKNTVEIIQKHINEPVPNPAKLRPDLPGWLAMAIQKLMSKKPEERFDSAKATHSYFTKMRAEEQLRVKTVHGRASMNLGIESSLKIAEEENHSTETIRKMRAEDVYRSMTAHHTQPGRRPKANPTLMPNLEDLSKQTQAPKGAPPPAPTQELVPPKPVQQSTVEAPQPAVTEVVSHFNKKDLTKLFLLLPVFALVACFIGYVFFSLGKICSVYVSETAGFVSNLIAPLRAGKMAPGQLLYTGLALASFLGIFALSSIRIFSRSTTMLLAMAIVGYLAGLFTPNVAFFDMSHFAQYLFSAEYSLCYFIVVASATLSVCWTINRSWAERVLGAALVILAAVLTFASTSLTISADIASPYVKIILLAAFLFGVLTLYYLLTKQEKTIVLPSLCFIACLSCFWLYNVSGLAGNIQTTLNTMVESIPMKDASAAQQRSQDESQSGFLEISRPGALAAIGSDKEINYFSEEEKNRFLDDALQKYAGDMIEQSYYPLYIDLLKTYYLYGPSKTFLKIWDYASGFPLENFNRHAQSNNAYFFLMILLFIMACVNCTTGILFKEDL